MKNKGKKNKKYNNNINLPISSFCYYSKDFLVINKSEEIKKTIINTIYFCTKQKCNKKKDNEKLRNINLKLLNFKNGLNISKKKINKNNISQNNKNDNEIENKENNNIDEFDINNISKNNKIKSHNINKIEKDELYSLDSSVEYKEYEKIKQNKFNSKDKIYNFMSLSNEKFKGKI